MRDPAADPAAIVTGPVVIDSRQAEPGALFAALPGSAPTGTTSPPQAVAAGAAAVLATRPPGVPALIVPDVLAALAALARAVVDRLPGLTIAAITGSAGKTTTKDLAAQLIERLGPTVSPRNSYNNEIGHPLTVLRLTARDQVPGRRDVRARRRAHRRAVRDLAAPARRGAVRRARARRDVRQHRRRRARPRASCPRRCPPTASPC